MQPGKMQEQLVERPLCLSWQVAESRPLLCVFFLVPKPGIPVLCSGVASGSGSGAHVAQGVGTPLGC